MGSQAAPLLQLGLPLTVQIAGSATTDASLSPTMAGDYVLTVALDLGALSAGAIGGSILPVTVLESYRDFSSCRLPLTVGEVGIEQALLR